MKLSLVLFIMSSLLLVACGDNKEKSQVEATQVEKKHHNVIADPQLRALEKARGVEQLIMDSTKKRDQDNSY